jgi:hypothetical protein
LGNIVGDLIRNPNYKPTGTVGNCVLDEDCQMKCADRDSWPNAQAMVGGTKIPFAMEMNPEQFNQLRKGFIPQAMEDKWFAFMEDDQLYFHRSWTGRGIYHFTFTRDQEKYVVSEALVATMTPHRSIAFHQQVLRQLIEMLLLRRGR